MTTPVRRQYLHIKKQFPGTIVFFRLGDFYETFDADAKIVSATRGSQSMTQKFLVPQFRLNRKGTARFLGTLEARIMEIVWKKGTVSVQEVCDSLVIARAPRVFKDA